MADTTFPRMSGWKNGYDPKQVDSFFKRARESFERPTPQPGDLDSRAVRTVGFDLVRKGYHVAVVDAALDRLEDAFAKQARDRLIAQSGQDAWVQELTRVAASLRGRLVRESGSGSTTRRPASSATTSPRSTTCARRSTPTSPRVSR